MSSLPDAAQDSGIQPREAIETKLYNTDDPIGLFFSIQSNTGGILSEVSIIQPNSSIKEESYPHF
jgi:hypothetical protein